jgi:hypothetical protein
MTMQLIIRCQALQMVDDLAEMELKTKYNKKGL